MSPIIDHRYSSLGEAGALFIDLRPQFDVLLRFAPWEAGMTIARWTGQGWETETVDPQIALVDGETPHEADTPVFRYVQQIPAEIRAAVAPFGLHQLTLLQWTARDLHARDLLLSNPMLLWLLVDAVPYLDVMKYLLREKQRVLLQALLGTGTQPMLRLLRNLRLWRPGPREITLLRKALTSPLLLPVLSRLPAINRTLLFLAERRPEVVMLPIVKELPSNRETPGPRVILWAIRVNRLRKDLLELGFMLRHPDYRQSIDRCTSLAQLQRLHDRWTNRLNRIQRPYEKNIFFPAPPLPGNETIRPILTLGALSDEGQAMRHCVRSYARHIFSGRSYIYQVFYPERGTLELNLARKPPVIAQFRLARNQTPSPASWQQVTQWLKAAVGS